MRIEGLQIILNQKEKESLKDFWKKYHKMWGLGDKEYEIGDIVTRNGNDEHIILDIDYPWMVLTVECIKTSENWHKIGDTEDNLIRRYSLVRKSKKLI